MPTIRELEDAFKVYTDDMDRCVRGGCYWALLHVVVVIPDICGALETPNGEATGVAYRDWCRRQLPAQLLTPDERYHVRCIVLHQGRTLASAGRYTYYKFTQPFADGTSPHGSQPAPGQIVLDVAAMAIEMVHGLRGWFAALQQPAEATRAANVARNLPTLVTGEGADASRELRRRASVQGDAHLDEQLNDRRPRYPRRRT